MKAWFALMLLPLLGGQASPVTTSCSMRISQEQDVSTVFHGRNLHVGDNVLSYVSGLEIDYDGAPDAYHRGGVGTETDPGLDHICNGGDVMEVKDGKLVAKYYRDGSMRTLSGGNSALCKADYIALREAGFPACGPEQRECMRFFGIKTKPRSCGYDRAADKGCGEPILQTIDGKKTDFYVTTNRLLRPGAPRDSDVQRDYADAMQVPFVVLPGGARYPGNMRPEPGDLVLLAFGQHKAWGVVGDTGPSTKLGEASPAMRERLGIMHKRGIETGATTFVFPGSAGRLSAVWPLTGEAIDKAGAELLAARGDAAAIAACFNNRISKKKGGK
ncbi:hypothetical protein [Sphingopyxis sp.]|uniref:hypothetical protein n=1 Tax=Sphingopyxis sp. TaxID=1908224 RepID=UPI002DE709A1|nr:hypothetical protein [Sphingopyxis sp.]